MTQPSFLPELPISETIPGAEFTGIARSIQAYLNNGEFKNYRILTLHIKKGKVTQVDLSDPYANFEALAKMELANELSLMHLNNTWENGKTLSK